MVVRNVVVDPEELEFLFDDLVDCIEVDVDTLEVVHLYLNEPCHHFMRDAAYRIEGLVHILPEGTDLEYMYWLVNHSFMSGSLEYVSINDGEYKGVLVHPSENKNRFGAMCVAVRMGWEYLNDVRHIMKLGEKIGDTDSAFFIVQCFSTYRAKPTIRSDDAHKAVYPSQCTTLSVVNAITNPDEYWEKSRSCYDEDISRLTFSKGFAEDGMKKFVNDFVKAASKYVILGSDLDTDVNPFNYPIAHEAVVVDGTVLVSWKDIDKEIWASIKKEIVDVVY